MNSKNQAYSNTNNYIINLITNNYSIICLYDNAVKLEAFNGDFYKKASYMAKDKNVIWTTLLQNYL